MLTGTSVFGIGFAMGLIPTMPEILGAIEETDLQFDKRVLLNNVAGYFVVC